MGQYGNQPDFITTDIKSIDALNGFVSDTPSEASYLGGSLIYIGGAGNLSAIPAGIVGASTVTKLVSPGYSGSGGTGYTSDEYQTSGGSGTGLDVNITAVNGVVVSVDEIVGGEDSGYLNGELVTIDATGSGNPGDDNAVFRVVAAPGLPTILDAIPFASPPQGAWFPVPVDYVMATGTTATLLLAGK
tara:strand:+ start:44 stop:607 length:564 start_codon:yes stop_codon:yes gene_type:complete